MTEQGFLKNLRAWMLEMGWQIDERSGKNSLTGKMYFCAYVSFSETLSPRDWLYGETADEAFRRAALLAIQVKCEAAQ